MAIAGGIIGAWLFTKDPFWMMSGALAGIISVASGLDIYWPGLTFLSLQHLFLRNLESMTRLGL